MTTQISTADFEEIRATTLAANETPALFETVAEISGVDEDDDETTFSDQEGLAVNAYGSPLSLWEMKSGHYTPTPPAKRSLWSRIKWGVCWDVIEDLGLQGRKAEGTVVNTDMPYLSSRVDMEVAELDEHWEPMIAKNVANTSIAMWRNAVGQWVVPESVLIEAHHHMLVRGSERCWVVALFGGVTPHHFKVERDEDLCADIQDAALEFWELVKKGKRPKPKGDRDQKVIARLNAIINPTEAVIDLRGDTPFLKLLAEEDRLKAEAKDIEKKLNEIQEAKRLRMDGKGSAIISDTHQLRWINLPPKTVNYTTKASAYLRVSKINPKAAGESIETLAQTDAS